MCALVAFAPAGAAQESGAPRADAQVTLSVRATRLAGSTDFMLGGDLLLGVSESMSLGGTGWVLGSPASVPTESGPSDLRLDVGYGGAVLERVVLERGGRTVAVRLTVGAGHAEVSLTGVGTEIAADNFGLVEPEVTGSVALGGSLSIRAQLGYRMVFGVEDLPGVTKDHLRGASLTVGFSLRSPGRP